MLGANSSNSGNQQQQPHRANDQMIDRIDHVNTRNREGWIRRTDESTRNDRSDLHDYLTGYDDNALLSSPNYPTTHFNSSKMGDCGGTAEKAAKASQAVKSILPDSSNIPLLNTHLMMLRNDTRRAEEMAHVGNSADTQPSAAGSENMIRSNATVHPQGSCLLQSSQKIGQEEGMYLTQTQSSIEPHPIAPLVSSRPLNPLDSHLPLTLQGSSSSRIDSSLAGAPNMIPYDLAHEQMMNYAASNPYPFEFGPLSMRSSLNPPLPVPPYRPTSSSLTPQTQMYRNNKSLFNPYSTPFEFPTKSEAVGMQNWITRTQRFINGAQQFSFDATSAQYDNRNPYYMPNIYTAVPVKKEISHVGLKRSLSDIVAVVPQNTFKRHSICGPVEQNKSVIPVQQPEDKSQQRHRRIVSQDSTASTSSMKTQVTPVKRDEEDEEGKRRRRHQVRVACVHCKKSCKKCDEARPCVRCIRLGLVSTCVDAPRKIRGDKSNYVYDAKVKGEV